MRGMRIVLFSIMVILGLGCAFFIEEQLEAWKGFHRDELIRAMGPPTEETVLPEGGNRIVFIQRITRRPSGGQVYGASRVCRMVFETDAAGIIQSASQTGC